MIMPGVTAAANRTTFGHSAVCLTSASERRYARENANTAMAERLLQIVMLTMFGRMDFVLQNLQTPIRRIQIRTVNTRRPTLRLLDECL